jgi:K+-transporting ATPase KdpF subunit
MVVRHRLRSHLGGFMGLEYLLGVIVSFVIMGYLIVALLYPEKF